MSIYKDGKLIAGGRQCMPLLSFMWADHVLNDASWLRADTFSWQSGSVYQVAYQHLADDITGKTLQSETISGTTIQFYLADDGHKICPTSEESNVTAIYNATGVAWYYIIDTTNQRFKLPRINPDLLKAGATSADVVTNGETLKMTAGGQVDKNFVVTTWNLNGYKALAHLDGGSQPAEYASAEIKFASESGLRADLTTATGYFAGAKYLYFYVGQFTQTALENTAGLNAELFNGKADLNLSNTASNIDFVVESQEPTAANNYTWYRKYKSGWVEQGGMVTGQADSTNKSITFPVAFQTIVFDYNVHNTRGSGVDQYAFQIGVLNDPTLTGMIVRTVCNGTTNYVWSVKGI